MHTWQISKLLTKIWDNYIFALGTLDLQVFKFNTDGLAYSNLKSMGMEWLNY